jgi:hypothetical protein
MQRVWISSQIGKTVHHLDQPHQFDCVQATQTGTRAILKSKKNGSIAIIDCARPDGRRDWKVQTFNIGEEPQPEKDPCSGSMETTRLSVSLPFVVAERASQLASLRGIDRDTLICQLINSTEEGIICED